MAENDPTEFVCPGCGSGYKVVRVKADADLPHRLIHCRVCKQPLAAIDGEFVVKYFLLRRGKAKRQKAPQGSGAYKRPRRGAGLRRDAVTSEPGKGSVFMVRLLGSADC